MVLSSSDWETKNKELHMGEQQLSDVSQNTNMNASTLDEILKIHAEMKKMNWFEGEDPFQVILETICVQREKLIKAAIWAYDLKLLADEAIGGNMLSDVEQELEDWLKSEKSSWEKEAEIASGKPDWNNAQISHIKSDRNRRASAATRSLWAWYGKNFPERIPPKFITTKEWSRAHKAWLVETNVERISKGLNFKISFYDRKLNGIRDFTIKENAGFFQNINSASALKLLTNVRSIGPETARTIALFYFHLPFLIFDSYLLRISRRHRWISENSNKWNAENKRLVENYIFSWLAICDEKKKSERLKAFHAIIDDWGNKYCSEGNPNCTECDLRILFTEIGQKPIYLADKKNEKNASPLNITSSKKLGLKQTESKIGDSTLEYKRDFSLIKAYDFLEQNGLAHESVEIKNSSDQYMSYTSRLKRAKIVALLKKRKQLDCFCDSVWQYGHSNSGKSHIKFLESLLDRFNSNKMTHGK